MKENDKLKSSPDQKEGLSRIVAPLLAWYDQGRRILPWREDPTPYHVWVSEIMLQQTRVEAVKPYYDRFMSALPDISSLSKAPEEILLKLWEGLGYYNRVRNLKKAAQQIMTEYEGQMPAEYTELLKLAGIGSYTAGAISSIAFQKKRPAVDGNVLRVLSRLRMDERDIMQAAVKAEVERELLSCMPEDRPGDFNQAMMELGAMVCVPNGAPKCEACPLQELCLAHQSKVEQSYPIKRKKKPRTLEEKTVLVIWDEDKVALWKRPDKGLLAGMMEFPALDGSYSEGEVLDYLKQEGLSILHIETLTESRHIFTHREWHMRGYAIRVDELAEREKGRLIFADQKEILDKYTIPTAYQVYREYVYQMTRRKGEQKEYEATDNYNTLL